MIMALRNKKDSEPLDMNSTILLAIICIQINILTSEHRLGCRKNGLHREPLASNIREAFDIDIPNDTVMQGSGT